MKYSRDLARTKLNDQNFNKVIADQVKQISSIGANYIAIDTPYDEEFLPYLRRWVNAARQNKLHVWFRGNWSGWEQWFDYPRITPNDHVRMTQNFILSHPELFQDGDIFSPCPECENGSIQDPRFTKKITEFRQFLISLKNICESSFIQINIQVNCSYFSLNGDVAKLIMDHETTTRLGGIVVIDHYVYSPEKFFQDIRELQKSSGGKIVIGEFGIPVPDIHGKVTSAFQAEWIDSLLKKLITDPDIIGLNYWTSHGASTSLWTDSSQPTQAVDVIKSYYQPKTITIKVKGLFNLPTTLFQAVYLNAYYKPNQDGLIYLPYTSGSHQVILTSSDYQTHGFMISQDYSSYDVNLYPLPGNYVWLFLKELTYKI